MDNAKGHRCMSAFHWEIRARRGTGCWRALSPVWRGDMAAEPIRPTNPLMFWGPTQQKQPVCLLQKGCGSIAKKRLKHQVGTPQLVASLPPFMMLAMAKEVKGIRAPGFFLVSFSGIGNYSSAGEAVLKQSPSKSITVSTLAVWQCTRHCSS